MQVMRTYETLWKFLEKVELYEDKMLEKVGYIRLYAEKNISSI